MKAIVCTKYGPPEVLQLKEVEKPTPQEDEALVKVMATSLNAADFEALRGAWSVRVAAPRKPMYKILGSDVAGRVEMVGSNVKQFQPVIQRANKMNVGIIAMKTITLSLPG